MQYKERVQTQAAKGNLPSVGAVEVTIQVDNTSPGPAEAMRTT